MWFVGARIRRNTWAIAGHGVLFLTLLDLFAALHQPEIDPPNPATFLFSLTV